MHPMINDEIVIFTCVTNGFDKVRPVPKDFPIKCILFTDDIEKKVKGWDTCYISSNKISPIKSNRLIKIKLHPEILKYKNSLYIDGNVELHSKSLKIIKEFLNSKFNIALNRHPRFNSVYEDLFEIFRVGIADGNKVISVLKQCIRLDISNKDSFYECNIIFRKHNAETLNFLDDWWHFFKTGTGRDQAAFVMAAKKNEFSILDLNLGDCRTNPGKFFSINNHDIKKNISLRLLKRLLSELKLTRIRFYLHTRKFR